MNNLLFSSSAIVALLLAGEAQAQKFGDWGRAQAVESAAVSEGGAGCPIIDPDTHDLYIASSRPGTHGANDIWRAEWDGTQWGTPVNVGGPINTELPEYCPSPARGRRFFFIRAGDMYMSRNHPIRGFSEPERLSDAINVGSVWSPTYVEDEDGTAYLYFSSDRDGTQDIWVSVDFGAPTKIAELSTDDGTEIRPNVRRNRLEMAFDDGTGNIFISTRASTAHRWGTPVLFRRGRGSRASFSWDGTTLVWGSGGIIFSSERSRRTGRKARK